MPPSSALEGNRYDELKVKRKEEAQEAIRKGLINDPAKQVRLEDAIDLVGTCMSMCPEFEREEREYQQLLDEFERYAGTKRVDPLKAVKTFHRPTDNGPILPSDVRPPAVLAKTLDYLFHDLMENVGFEKTHHFIRDRTRSVRQDFTLQNIRSEAAIVCHERIARYHLIALSCMPGVPQYSNFQELEQFRKILTSLMEFYDDNRKINPGIVYPHEAEFRAYAIITHMADDSLIWASEMRLPDLVLKSDIYQTALQLRRYCQQVNNFDQPDAVLLQGFVSFFKLIASSRVSYLLASCALTHFDIMRQTAFNALRRAFQPQIPDYTLRDLVGILGLNNEADAREMLQAVGIDVIEKDGESVAQIHRRVVLSFNKFPSTQNKVQNIVLSKKGTFSLSHLIDTSMLTAPPLANRDSIWNDPKTKEFHPFQLQLSATPVAIPYATRPKVKTLYTLQPGKVFDDSTRMLESLVEKYTARGDGTKKLEILAQKDPYKPQSKEALAAEASGAKSSRPAAKAGLNPLASKFTATGWDSAPSNAERARPPPVAAQNGTANGFGTFAAKSSSAAPFPTSSNPFLKDDSVFTKKKTTSVFKDAKTSSNIFGASETSSPTQPASGLPSFAPLNNGDTVGKSIVTAPPSANGFTAPPAAETKPPVANPLFPLGNGTPAASLLSSKPETSAAPLTAPITSALVPATTAGSILVSTSAPPSAPVAVPAVPSFTFNSSASSTPPTLPAAPSSTAASGITQPPVQTLPPPVASPVEIKGVSSDSEEELDLDEVYPHFQVPRPGSYEFRQLPPVRYKPAAITYNRKMTKADAYNGILGRWHLHEPEPSLHADNRSLEIQGKSNLPLVKEPTPEEDRTAAEEEGFFGGSTAAARLRYIKRALQEKQGMADAFRSAESAPGFYWRHAVASPQHGASHVMAKRVRSDGDSSPEIGYTESREVANLKRAKTMPGMQELGQKAWESNTLAAALRLEIDKLIFDGIRFSHGDSTGQKLLYNVLVYSDGKMPLASQWLRNAFGLNTDEGRQTLEGAFAVTSIQMAQGDLQPLSDTFTRSLRLIVLDTTQLSLYEVETRANEIKQTLRLDSMTSLLLIDMNNRVPDLEKAQLPISFNAFSPNFSRNYISDFERAFESFYYIN